jgi:hypothetical protein
VVRTLAIIIPINQTVAKLLLSLYLSSSPSMFTEQQNTWPGHFKGSLILILNLPHNAP